MFEILTAILESMGLFHTVMSPSCNCESSRKHCLEINDDISARKDTTEKPGNHHQSLKKKTQGHSEDNNI